MHIIEQKTIAKRETTKNEDGIVVTNNHIAVIDGSTSKSKLQISTGISNGRYCMMLICQFITKLCPADISASNFCSLVTHYVRSHYPAELLSTCQHNPEKRMAASCACYSRHHNELWLIGDCQALVNGKHYDNPKPSEAHLAAKRSEINKLLLAEGKTTVAMLQAHDIGRESIIPEMIVTMKEQNITYAVIDGFEIPFCKVRVIRLPPAPSEVVIATDGYPLLYPTLTESEEALRQQQASDPLNINTFKATKAFNADCSSFDDRTYIRFTT